MRVALLALLLTGLHPVAAPAQSASRVVDSLGTALTASHDGAAVIGRLYADTTAV